MDALLIGDSVGMVVLGYPDTTLVTMEEILHHTRAVTRGSEAGGGKALLLAEDTKIKDPTIVSQIGSRKK